MGWTAIVAGIAFGLAIAMLALFFATKNERYDRVAEWSFVVFAITGLPAILATASHLGSIGLLGQVMTFVGVISVAVIGLAELAATLRLIDFRRISAVVSLAFVGFLLWIGAVSAAAVTSGDPSTAFGWLGLVSIVVGIALVAVILATPGVARGEREPNRNLMFAFFLPMAGIVAWMIWLGLLL